jgi:hypothetical protein
MAGNNKFEEFQLEEYKNISNAHFETNKQISSFFRYYLLIAWAPIGIVFFLGKKIDMISDLWSGKLTLFETNFFGVLLIVIGIIGICSFYYMVNMIADSTMYARSVNGVRKYFYDQVQNGDLYRVLPTDKEVPKGINTSYYITIMIFMGGVNALYLCLSSYIISLKGNESFNSISSFWINENYGLLDVICYCLVISVLHWWIAKRVRIGRDKMYSL